MIFNCSQLSDPQKRTEQEATAMKDQELLLYGGGDIMPYEANPDYMFEKLAPLFTQQNAIAFGQFEGVATDRGSPAAQARLPLSVDITLPACLKRCGFDIVSCASNHALDWGREGFLDTLQYLEEAGVAAVGAGRDEEQAREIRIIEKNGTKVAFLAYCSILPQDYWALEKRPGVNPARGITASVPVEHDQPGTRQRIYTFPHPDDLKNMLEDIHRAKEIADIVVVSMHWGIHIVRAELADYQRYYAHFAIDAGADLVLGHHAHTIKPIEVYKGKAIFYSLGNFVCNNGLNPRDLATLKQDHATSRRHKEMAANRSANLPPAPGRRHTLDYYMHTLAKCVICDKKIVRVSYLPCFLQEDNVTVFPEPGSENFEAINLFMQEITEEVGLDTAFTLDGGEVVLV